MARARKSHNTDEENIKPSRNKLPAAVSPKVGGNRYPIYVDYSGRIIVALYNQYYAARWFINSVIGPTGSYEWIEPFAGRQCIRTDAGVRIGMYGPLKDILDYEMSEEELAWSDPPMSKNILHLKYGSWNNEKSDGEDEAPDLPKHAVAARAIRAERKETSPTAKSNPPKRDLSEYVSANDIARELKLEGREVRGILRHLKLEKPSHGWSWPKEEATNIRAQVVAALHNTKGKKK